MEGRENGGCKSSLTTEFTKQKDRDPQKSAARRRRSAEKGEPKGHRKQGKPEGVETETREWQMPTQKPSQKRRAESENWETPNIRTRNTKRSQGKQKHRTSERRTRSAKQIQGKQKLRTSEWRTGRAKQSQGKQKLRRSERRTGSAKQSQGREKVRMSARIRKREAEGKPGSYPGQIHPV